MVSSRVVNSLLLCLFFHQGYSQDDTTSVDEKQQKFRADSIVVQTGIEFKAPPAKKSIYTLKPAVDIPVIAAGTIFTIFATTKIYTKGTSTEAQINNLNIDDI